MHVSKLCYLHLPFDSSLHSISMVARIHEKDWLDNAHDPMNMKYTKNSHLYSVHAWNFYSHNVCMKQYTCTQAITSTSFLYSDVSLIIVDISFCDKLNIFFKLLVIVSRVILVEISSMANTSSSTLNYRIKQRNIMVSMKQTMVYSKILLFYDVLLFTIASIENTSGYK